jgi:hypothetical protein
VFTTDPISNLDGIELTPYTGQSLTDYADGIGTFSKESGPEWLFVLPNGTLSGIPKDANVGQNTFTVRYENTSGDYDTATMTIDVANIYSGVRGMEDLAGLAGQWMAQSCGDTPPCDGADLSGDTNVDIWDLEILAHNWLADESLQLYLPFEEMAGNVTEDTSLYAYSADLVNGPTWTAGHSGGGLNFDGIDDYVEVPGYKGITGGASRTCYAWIKTSEPTGEIIGWGEEYPGGRWVIRVNEGGQLRAEVQGGNIIGTTLINDGAWHHIAVVLEDDGSPDISEAVLYVDGNPETISASADEPVQTGSEQNVRVGMYFIAERYFNGLIDEVRIYDRALSETEIQDLAAP